MSSIYHDDISGCLTAICMIICIIISIEITGIVLFSTSCYKPDSNLCFVHNYYEGSVMSSYLTDNICTSASGEQMECYNGYLKIKYDKDDICYINLFNNNYNYNKSLEKIQYYNINSTQYIDLDINNQQCEFYQSNKKKFYSGFVIMLFLPSMCFLVYFFACFAYLSDILISKLLNNQNKYEEKNFNTYNKV